MSNVYAFPSGRDLRIGERLSAARVLAAARQAKLLSVTVVGVEPNGERYVASTYENPADAVWEIEQGKLDLLRPQED